MDLIYNDKNLGVVQCDNVEFGHCVQLYFLKYILRDFLQNPELRKTVRGELCLPMMVFRHPQA